MKLPFPGITVTISSEALILRSEQTLSMLSSAVVGGGLTEARYILNYHVHKNYNNPQPERDLVAYAYAHSINEPFVGLMTAAYVEQARTATVTHNGLMVSAVITAGLSNAFSAGRDRPRLFGPGTINMILLIDGNLYPAAMVNALITATEAKTDVLRAHGVQSHSGYAATGTSTDAIVVACTGSGDPILYAGPATSIGWSTANAIRQAMEEAIT